MANHRDVHRRALLASLPAVVTAGCTIGGEPPAEDDLSLTIPAFHDGAIPERYTCDGDGISPELRVDGVPEAVESLAIVGEWLYGITPGTIWLLWDLPATAQTIPEARPGEPRLDDPAGARQGTNDEGFVGYRSPCQETPDHDEYRFTLLALEAPLDLDAGAGGEAFDDATDGKVAASTAVTATYDRDPA
jgi:Raf kinase inhibitor-like YbhB/YbcL family protein